MHGGLKLLSFLFPTFLQPGWCQTAASQNLWAGRSWVVGHGLRGAAGALSPVPASQE